MARQGRTSRYRSPRRTNAKQGDFLTFDTTGIEEYVKYLKTLDYKDIDRELQPVIRQIANEVKKIVKRHTPIRADQYVDQSTGKARKTYQGSTGKYGATPGNLQRSMQVFPWRKKTGTYTVGASVGPKLHNRKSLQRKIAANKKITDGYYWFFVNYGVAGRNGKSINTSLSQGFIDRARTEANRTINARLTDRGKKVIERRLNKKLNR